MRPWLSEYEKCNQNNPDKSCELSGIPMIHSFTKNVELNYISPLQFQKWWELLNPHLKGWQIFAVNSIRPESRSSIIRYDPKCCSLGFEIIPVIRQQSRLSMEVYPFLAEIYGV
jgi:hypothetical protein